MPAVTPKPPAPAPGPPTPDPPPAPRPEPPPTGQRPNAPSPSSAPNLPARIEIDRSEPEVIIVVLRGEHDLHGARKLRGVLEQATDNHENITLELSVVSFIDSTILGEIIRGLRQAREHGLGFTLVVAEDGSISRLLATTGLLAFFPSYDTRMTAIAAARSGVNEPR